MKYSIFVLLLLLLASTGCSSYSLKNATLKGATLGLAIGAPLGYTKGKSSNVKLGNAAIVGGTSAILGATISYFMHKLDPSKNPLPRRDRKGIDSSDCIYGDEREKCEGRNSVPTYNLDLGMRGIKINPTFKASGKVVKKIEAIPEEYQKHFPDVYVETYQMEPQILKDGQKTTVIRNCEAIIQKVGE